MLCSAVSCHTDFEQNTTERLCYLLRIFRRFFIYSFVRFFYFVNNKLWTKLSKRYLRNQTLKIVVDISVDFVVVNLQYYQVGVLPRVMVDNL